jgi:hypothetical protein
MTGQHFNMETATTPGETRRHPRWAGIILLFGCFVALCALFALVVTAGVAWQEHRETQWPEATATIQQCSVERASSRSSANIIECRVRYVVGDKAVLSRVHSMSSPSPEKVFWEFPRGKTQEMFEKMQDWVEAHPPGTTIALRYHPDRHAKTALVATDMPLGGPQTPTNIKTTEGVAGLSAVLLVIGTLARRLSAH